MSEKEVLSGLTEALNLSPLVVESPEAPAQGLAAPSDPELSIEDQQAQEDFDFSRAEMKDILGKGKDALEGILRLANASEAPRAFEVAATLIKNLTEGHSRLLELHDQRRGLVPPPVEPEKTPEEKSTQQSGFVGTTQELLELIEQDRKLRAKTKLEASNVQETPKPE